MQRISNSFKHDVVDIEYLVLPSPPVRPGHPVSAPPPSHDSSDHISFIRELLVMATPPKLLFCSQAKREDDLATKDCIYLFAFCETNQMNAAVETTRQKFFFSFSFRKQQKAGRRKELWK